jgi:hypothetical protein
MELIYESKYKLSKKTMIPKHPQSFGDGKKEWRNREKKTYIPLPQRDKD